MNTSRVKIIISYLITTLLLLAYSHKFNFVNKYIFLLFRHLDEYILCCYAKKAVAGVRCISPKAEFSSCSDLMKNKGVQICVWILGITALVGNLLVILMRVFVKENNKVHSFLLTNLAISAKYIAIVVDVHVCVIKGMLRLYIYFPYFFSRG